MQRIDFSKYPLPKRWRHHVQPNLYFPFNEKNPNLSEYPPLIDKINWEEIFENSKAPNCLDIGCAWSRFLMNYAVQNPNDNILGIEIRKQTIEYAKDVIKNENISNANVIWYSVVNGLKFISDNSIDKAFYFFPDPWFKERHKKRRAFNMDFLNECQRILKKGATLYLQTDILEVHNYQLELLKEFDKFHLYTPEDSDWNLPRTDKEEECLRKGFDYWRLICRKL
jgi:tRNA (guanine-N7-)-methyltransferase